MKLEFLYFYSDDDRIETYSGFPVQSICVSWPKVKMGRKESGLGFMIKYRAGKILLMSCHLPLTAGAKLKTAITKSVDFDGTPFYPHLRGLLRSRVSQQIARTPVLTTACLLTGSGLLDSIPPSSWGSIDAPNHHPFSARTTQTPKYLPPSHPYMSHLPLLQYETNPQSAFEILKSLAPAPQPASPHPIASTPNVFVFFLFWNSHLVVIRIALLSISRE